MSDSFIDQPQLPTSERSMLGELLFLGTRCNAQEPAKAPPELRAQYEETLLRWFSLSLERRAADAERFMCEPAALLDSLPNGMPQIADLVPSFVSDSERCALQADLRLLSLRLLRAADTGDSSTRPPFRAAESGDWRIAAVVARARRAPDKRGLTLKAAAAELRVSPRHLGRLFTEITGVRFKRYAKALRLIVAADLLRVPDLAVKEIASKTGYSTQTNFSRDFSLATGLSPSMYRIVVSHLSLPYRPLHLGDASGGLAGRCNGARRLQDKCAQ